MLVQLKEEEEDEAEEEEEEEGDNFNAVTPTNADKSAKSPAMGKRPLPANRLGCHSTQCLTGR